MKISRVFSGNSIFNDQDIIRTAVCLLCKKFL